MPDILSFLPLRCEDLLPFLCFYVTENLMSFVSGCWLVEKKTKQNKTSEDITMMMTSIFPNFLTFLQSNKPRNNQFINP